MGNSVHLSELTLAPSVTGADSTCSVGVVQLSPLQASFCDVGLWEEEMRWCLCRALGSWCAFPHFHSFLFPWKPVSSPHVLHFTSLRTCPCPLFWGVFIHDHRPIRDIMSILGLLLYMAPLHHPAGQRQSCFRSWLQSDGSCSPDST